MAFVHFVDALFTCSSGEPRFDSQALKLIQTKNKMTKEELASYLPYIHERVEKPIGGGVVLSVPEEIAHQPFAKWGVLDVTAKPFSVDSSGENDCTSSIQMAIDFARDHQMVAFFPAGKYQISDTILCRQKLTVRGNGRLSVGANYPCVLVGSSDSENRSVFFLSPESPGFTDKENRKTVVHFTNCNCGCDKGDFESGPLRPQTNVNYNQLH